jgi:50S ribosomal subunit-associated GTPase HflX
MIDEVMALKDTQLFNIEKSMSVSTVDRANLTPNVFAQMVRSACKISRASVNVQVDTLPIKPETERGDRDERLSSNRSGFAGEREQHG